MRTATLLASITLLLAACGGSAAAGSGSQDTSQTASSGGETPAQTTASSLPATTPIPVPQPAVPREQLSQPLQHVWELVERAVEVRPPQPPTEATREAIDAWAGGPFREWVAQRGVAVHAVEEAEAPLQTSTGHERGVAAGLFGYLYEETAAGARGAPVPADLAADSELLGIYGQALLESLQPYARASAESYAACVHVFADLHAADWNEWGQYCLDRGREVIETYELVPPTTPAPDASAPPPDGAAAAAAPPPPAAEPEAAPPAAPPAHARGRHGHGAAPAPSLAPPPPGDAAH